MKFQRLFDVLFRDKSEAVEGSFVSRSPQVSLTRGPTKLELHHLHPGCCSMKPA